MRIVFSLLGLLVCSCLAAIEENPIDAVPLKEEELTDELRKLREETHPSFDEIKQKLEEDGTLSHDSVIGLFPRRVLNVSTPTPRTKPTTPTKQIKLPVIPYRPRPLCPELARTPVVHHIGFTASILFHDFRCPKTCGHCGKIVGRCQKTRTAFTLRALVFGYHYNPVTGMRTFGWYWFYRSILIPGCCKCYSTRP